MGYDISRFNNSDINQEFICGICQEVLQNPLVIELCDHIFCSECIFYWMNEQSKCPVDRTKISTENLHKPFRSFMNLLNELEINCEFCMNGCKQYIKLGELESHKSKCEFNPDRHVVCSCGVKLLREEYAEHLNDCINYLKNEIKTLINENNEMAIKLDKIGEELTLAKRGISFYSEWKRIKEINIKETNMPHIMIDGIIKLIKKALNEETFDAIILCGKICDDFGGNWKIFIGHQLTFPNYVLNNFMHFEIGKFNGLVYMNVKPVYDVMFIDKALKSLQSGIEKKVCSDQMINTWNSIFKMTDDSLNISERFLDKNGMHYIIKCNDLFPFNNGDLFFPMVGVLVNISEFPQLRYHLMRTEYIEILVKLLSNPNFAINFLSSFALSNMLSEGKIFWKQNLGMDSNLYRKIILAKLKSKISDSKLNTTLEFDFSFTTFKPIIRLLKCDDNIPSEVQYFAVWTLVYITRKDCGRSCRLLKEDNCIEDLKKLIEYKKTENNVKRLAKLVLYQNRLFLKDGNLDKLQNSETMLSDS